MSTKDTTGPEPIDVVEKLAKRASVSLTAGGSRLTIVARRTRGDGGETVVVTTDAKKKTARGMTTKYDTFDLAVQALRKLAEDATQRGWHKSQKTGGFKPRPDAFTSMPQAPKVTK
jgi:hypothetical protein